MSLDWNAAGTFGVLDGQPPTRLLPVMLADPSWSPTGDRVAFEYRGDIYTIGYAAGTFDTLGVEQLTSDGRNFNPAWSPDGTTIAFLYTGCFGSGLISDSTQCGIRGMTPTGGEKRMLVSGTLPAWYPDSHRLLYAGLHFDLFICDLLDSTTTQLTDFNTASITLYDVAVAPDGLSIAVAIQRAGEPLHLAVMDANGSNLHLVVDVGIYYPICWSPNSDHILYVNYDASDFSEDNGSLWMVDVLSGESHRLVHGSLE